MLDPTAQDTLLEALQPPDGFEFSEAIATTFSLDLVALLAAPLGFLSTTASADLRTEWTTDTALTVLRALQMTARRLSVFCDATHVAVPRNGQALMTMLEPAVVIARAAHPKGAFHPKVWLSRYVERDNAESVRYRLLVLTRNLTFDRSLDLIAKLEGVRRQTAVTARSSAQVRLFVESLAGLAVHPLSDHHGKRITRIAEEVGRCDFAPVEPFAEGGWRFHVFGTSGAKGTSPLEAYAKRRLVISPFLSAGTLTQAIERSEQLLLISREAALVEINLETLKAVDALLVPRRVLTEAASAEEEPQTQMNHSVQPGDLHAKCYVHDNGSAQATWFVGSANATHSAFHRNVEVLLELQGPRRLVGIDSLLPPAVLLAVSRKRKAMKEPAIPPLQRNPTFADLWEPFEPANEPMSEVLMEARANQERADDVARELTGLPWQGVVEPALDGYSLSLQLKHGDWPDIEDAKVSVRPLTIAETRPFVEGGDPPLTWSPIAIESLTAFWPVSVAVGSGATRGVRTFVLVTPLLGAPEGREAAVTRALLTDESRVIRFLELLLATDEDSVNNETNSPTDDVGSERSRNAGHSPSLLEPMLRAYAVRPQRVVEAGRLIEDLARTNDDGHVRLPDGLLELWRTFRSVLQRDGLWPREREHQEQST